jgi:hypothetical protein
MSTEVLERPSGPGSGSGEEGIAHIVLKSDWSRGYVEGQEVEALCGAMFVPTKDPSSLPICGDCKAVAERHGLDVGKVK